MSTKLKERAKKTEEEKHGVLGAGRESGRAGKGQIHSSYELAIIADKKTEQGGIYFSQNFIAGKK